MGCLSLALTRLGLVKWEVSLFPLVGDSKHAYRATVLRTERRQLDAFTGAYSYYVIMTLSLIHI